MSRKEMREATTARMVHKAERLPPRLTVTVALDDESGAPLFGRLKREEHTGTTRLALLHRQRLEPVEQHAHGSAVVFVVVQDALPASRVARLEILGKPLNRGCT